MKMVRENNSKRPNWGVLNLRDSLSRTTPLVWIFWVALIVAVLGLFVEFIVPFSFMSLTIIAVYIIFGAIVLYSMIRYLW
jgi:membrane protein YdbS with pleckstrin-like domain